MSENVVKRVYIYPRRHNFVKILLRFSTKVSSQEFSANDVLCVCRFHPGGHVRCVEGPCGLRVSTVDEKFRQQLRAPAEHPHECVGCLSELWDGRKSKRVRSLVHSFFHSFIHPLVSSSHTFSLVTSWDVPVFLCVCQTVIMETRNADGTWPSSRPQIM